MSETLDLMVDTADYKKPIPVTINTLQRVIGLLVSLARHSKLGKSLMFVPVAEHNYFLEKLAAENDPKNVKISQQTKCCVLSLYARRNILLWRSMLLSSHIARLPMEDDRTNSRVGGGAHYTLFTDASGRPQRVMNNWGEINKDYKPTCLGIFTPRTVSSSYSTLRSFIIPYNFLMGRDQYGPVFYNMAFLELLPIAAELLRDPEMYMEKTVHVYLDNQAAVIMFREQKAKKLYCAYLLEILNYILSALKTQLKIKWLPRRSSLPAELADDATHAVFENVGPDTRCTRHSLPGPLEKLVTSTVSYSTHTFGDLRKNIRKYLSDIIPGLSFPY